MVAGLCARKSVAAKSGARDPISTGLIWGRSLMAKATPNTAVITTLAISVHCCRFVRSEEHTSELQSRLHLVCRLLLEKKKKSQPSRGLPADQPSLPPQLTWYPPVSL